MMILLVAINAKYIHSNLAVYSLKAYADDPNVELVEYTINQQVDDVLMDIYRKRPDVLCFSCYIWNLDFVEELIREFGKLRPGMPIWLGGPEVSYDAGEVLRRLPQVKGVMKGEGEVTFAKLCRIYHCVDDFSETVDISGRKGENFQQNVESFLQQVDHRLLHVDGITFRLLNGDVVENSWREVMDLSEVPFVYADMKEFEHKIVYYESSRGCPFSCSYCLSSVDKKLRFRDLSLVKSP